ncbi:neprilysin-2-like [Ixodes scapularis]|uniref:neprilysin-2-like n=1 Tax=Ixodes scapularis TaxID=6945 RepID=UPI001A9E0039|nr:neprilysin-2-like [Ixodes scapularis]
MSEAELHRRNLEHLLVSELRTGSDDGSLKWPLKLWEACRRETGERRSHDVFRNILKNHGLDGFPFRSDVALDVATRAAHVLRSSSIAAFVDVKVEKERSGSKSRLIIQIDPPETLFRGFVKMRDVHDEWFLSAVERLTGLRALPQLLKLEQALVALAGQRKKTKNYVRMSVSQLQHSRHWNWTVFLSTVFKGVTRIRKDTPVLTKGGSFQRQLLKIFEVFGTSNLLNYLGFRMYVRYALFLNFQDFPEVAAIAGSRLPGWADGDSKKDAADLRCLRILTQRMPELYAYIYWNAFLRNRHQLTESIEGMVENAMNEAIHHIGHLNITPQLTAKFRNDIFNLRKQIFIPQWLKRTRSRMDFSKLIFESAEDSELISWNEILEAQKGNALRRLTHGSFKTLWKGSVFDEDPWCSVDEGIIVVPIASVVTNQTGDAFQVHHSSRLGVRLVAAVIEHFTDMAFLHKSKFPAVHLRLELLGNCLQRQYYRDRPSSEAASHDDAIYLLALPAALRVFQQSVAGGSKNLRLPGVPGYNTDQLFFIEYALGRCEGYDDAYFHQRMHHGVRSPAPFTVNGPLRNFRPFAEAFGCRRGSYMNPRRVCHL